MSRAKEKFSIVSLGCARNLVDSEVMAGLLRQNEYEMVQEPADADVVLVNTCGFIGPAKEESIETILEVSRLKEEGKVKKLIVAGCLSQRYPEELASELPEVDFFIGTGEVPRIAEILREHERDSRTRQFVGVPSYIYDHVTPRLRSTPSYTAFLKVSEGCDHKCAFALFRNCAAAPQPFHRVRGQRNRAPRRRRRKRDQPIAQDLTAYGRDRKDGTTLYRLLSEMVKVPKLNGSGCLRLSEFSRSPVARTHPRSRQDLQIYRHPLSTHQPIDPAAHAARQSGSAVGKRS